MPLLQSAAKAEPEAAKKAMLATIVRRRIR
jgi:hypothetical protein